MTDSQYGNIIKCTLGNEKNCNEADETQAVMAILDNCGVAFPSGNRAEILSILKTDDYMGWRTCTFSDAQRYANEGVAAIGINGEHMAVITPEGNEKASALENAAARTVTSISLADRLDMQFFAYRAATTTPDKPKPVFIRPIKASFLPICDGREFGASGESRGDRDHAGIDFYVSNGKGTPVYACGAGTVTEYLNFYKNTYALAINNDINQTVLRYCEIESSLRVGDRVSKGQKIATIAQNDGGGTMLHLEFYYGLQKGSLTDRNNTTYDYVPNRNYQRRRDLLDPSLFATYPLE